MTNLSISLSCHNFFIKKINIYIYFYQTGENAAEDSLSIENTLWANTVVASGTALGLVIYTGMDTRSVMNTSQPKSKVSNLFFFSFPHLFYSQWSKGFFYLVQIDENFWYLL